LSRFFDYDPLTGAVETFDYDESSDTAIIHRSADVQPIIDRNKALANHTDGWTSAEKDMRHAASIPIEVCLLWLQRYGICAWKKEHWPKVRQLLNDNEWRYLRTNEFII
jgi:hypothetical protein